MKKAEKTDYPPYGAGAYKSLKKKKNRINNPHPTSTLSSTKTVLDAPSSTLFSPLI
jgi:hypothetical protein